MKRRVLAALGTFTVLVIALHWTSGENQKIQSTTVKMPRSIGAIHPRLSPDGQTIVFSYQGEIWTSPRTGGTMTLLTPSEGFDTEPAWSPDSKRIAFVRGATVKIVGFPGGTDVPLPKAANTGGVIGVNRLEFSADGKRLLASYRLSANENKIGWFDLATGDITPVASVKYFFTRFALSNDGKSIAVSSPPDQPGQQTGNDGSHCDVQILSVEGKVQQQFTFPARIHDMCWGHDNRSLIVATELGRAHDDLYKLPLDDPLRLMTKLTSGQADEDRPSISRDGKWLAYTDNRDGATAIMVRELGTNEEVAVRFENVDYGRPTGKLQLKVVDATDQKPIIARLSLKEDKGRFHAPPGALHRMLRNRGHFYCDGSAEMTIPAGTYKLTSYRGPEYKVAVQEIVIEKGATREVTVQLERWTNQAKDGWYSGEAHIHANYGFGQWFNSPETMRQQCVGEDLNVCNFMVANSTSDIVYDRPYFRGGPDPLSTDNYILYWNQEFRSTIWGHMTLLNLRQVVEPVFTGFKETTNPWDSPTNSDIADRTHWQKGLVNYTHPQSGPDPFKAPYAGKSLPVDVALGKIDTLDINHAWADAVPLWHRLLNCGFRIHATAGTDVFLNRINSNLPGGDRVYVLIDGNLTYDKWIDGLKAGRSFVSSGPVLRFSVNGRGPGNVLKAAAKTKVTVKAHAQSAFPLADAELIHNGKVIATAKLSADKLSATIDQEIELQRGGWLAFRARGPGTTDTASTTLNAHTNPVYLETGEDFRSPDDAREFLKWLDQLELVIRARDRFPTAKQREEALEQISAARTVYAKIIQDTKK
jgi:Tol biopolymer transport system component